jgi:hypothetical protein
VESLHKSNGGLGKADGCAQVSTLQAKLMAMLLHPRHQPWKLLMAMGWLLLLVYRVHRRLLEGCVLCG